MLKTSARRVGDQDVDWFYMTTVADAPQTALLQTWVMEYRDSFLGEWFSELKPATRGITRAEILERYAAKVGEEDERRQKLLEDVVEITLALPDLERAQLVKTCEAFEPANGIWIANSGALEVHDKHDEDDRIVAAFAPGEWVKATVDG